MHVSHIPAALLWHCNFRKWFHKLVLLPTMPSQGGLELICTYTCMCITWIYVCMLFSTLINVCMNVYHFNSCIHACLSLERVYTCIFITCVYVQAILYVNMIDKCSCIMYKRDINARIHQYKWYACVYTYIWSKSRSTAALRSHYGCACMYVTFQLDCSGAAMSDRNFMQFSSKSVAACTSTITAQGRFASLLDLTLMHVCIHACLSLVLCTSLRICIYDWLTGIVMYVCVIQMNECNIHKC